MSRREFQFVDGTSSKFWAIERSGSSFTVNWGRIGTAGQSQKKDFASDAAAEKEYEKLIAEKLKKGYSEITSSAGTPAPKAPPKPSAKPAATTAPQPASPPAASAASVPAKVSLDVTRRIDLNPQDWLIATWRPQTRLAVPPAKPFDLQNCTDRLTRVSTSVYGWQWNWEDAKIPVAMTPKEAHFWLAAMCEANKGVEPKALAAKLATGTYKSLTAEEAFDLLKHKQTTVTAEVLLPLRNVVPIAELAEAISQPVVGRPTHRADMPWYSDPQIITGMQEYVVPYLTDEELRILGEKIAPQLDPKNWPSDFHHRPPPAFFLAAMIGMSDELLPVVRSWKDDSYSASGWDHTHYHQPQIIVLGLGSAKLVEAEMRRLKLPLNKTGFIRGWLATTQYAALDYVRDCILAITNREECERLLETFALIKAPEAAPQMLELKLSSKAPKIAREWLEANLASAIAGLIPVAAGRGRLADAAIEHLLDMKRRGYGDAIRDALGSSVPERIRAEVLEHEEKQCSPFDDSSTPKWLADALKDAPVGKLPPWLTLRALPVLAIDANCLNDAQIVCVLGSLQKASLAEPHPLLQALRAHTSAESRDAFAWRLFESWLAEGAPSKDKWAMGAIGQLGADGCVVKLTPMIRNWPGESQHQRAVFGLECLRAVGSDIALMQLNGIAQKLKFKGLKAKAMEFMEAIAEQRKMTRSELEDRIVPDCDLDEKGTRLFDFGPRQFRFVLGPDLKAMIKDADGKVKSDLPSPGAKDDAGKAGPAVETWKLLKKQIRDIAKVQAERLEQAMVTGRRWSVADFESLLVKHPLMINFVRLLVWGGYDEAGTLQKTFRVTEDQTYGDEDDGETKLSGVSQVGIVHAVHLSQSLKQAWGEILSDYEIVPPFEQVGRPIYALDTDETGAKEIRRFGSVQIPATALVGTLERLAWTRGIPQDGGVFYEHTKPFYGANVTAVVNYEQGVPVGYMEGWEDQRITSCFFVPGIYTPRMYPDHKNSMQLGTVDKVAVSEVLKDLTLIASKGK